MKKTICFLLTAMMVAAITLPALAADVTASYDHGKLSVSTTAESWFRINVDGVGTGRSLTPKVPSLTFEYELSDGDHRIGISSDVAGGGTVTIKVVNGVSVNGSSAEESSAEESSLPSSETAKPVEHSTHTSVEIPAKEPTCTETGLTAGEKCQEGGEILTAQEIIPALGHRYMVAGKNGDTVSYKCVRCDAELKAKAGEAVQNRLGNIVTDEEGKPVDYTAGANQADEKVIVITVDKPAGEATLTLDTNLIVQLFREGYNSVEFVNGKADLVISLNSITKTWFSTEKAITAYLFTTNSEPETKTALRVEGLVESGTIEESQDTGLALK